MPPKNDEFYAKYMGRWASFDATPTVFADITTTSKGENTMLPKELMQYIYSSAKDPSLPSQKHCKDGSPSTVIDIFNTLSSAQRELVYALINKAIEDTKKEMLKDSRVQYYTDYTKFSFNPFGIKALAIKRIIFSGPATIIQWADGMKTIVKCSENDIYDPEKAVLMACMEKVMNSKHQLKKFLKKCLENCHQEKDESVCDSKVALTEDIPLKDVPLEDRQKAIRDMLETMTCAEAAATLGISETTVRRIRKKEKEC